MKIIFRTVVKRVFQRQERIHISGFGKDAQFDGRLTDWYLDIRGFGPFKVATAEEGKPDFKEGDAIRVTIEEDKPHAKRNEGRT